MQPSFLLVLTVAVLLSFLLIDISSHMLMPLCTVCPLHCGTLFQGYFPLGNSNFWTQNDFVFTIFMRRFLAKRRFMSPALPIRAARSPIRPTLEAATLPPLAKSQALWKHLVFFAGT